MMTDTKTEEEDDSDGGEVVTQVDLVEHVEEPGEDEQTYYRTQGGQMLPINVKVIFTLIMPQSSIFCSLN